MNITELMNECHSVDQQNQWLKLPKSSHIFQDPWEQTLQHQHGQTLGHKEPLDGPGL